MLTCMQSTDCKTSCSSSSNKKIRRAPIRSLDSFVFTWLFLPKLDSNKNNKKREMIPLRKGTLIDHLWKGFPEDRLMILCIARAYCYILRIFFESTINVEILFSTRKALASSFQWDLSVIYTVHVYKKILELTAKGCSLYHG